MAQQRLVAGTLTPAADRRSVLDRAHRGDIEGALGRVRSSDTAPRASLRRRVTTLFAIMGPGIVVMAADNDAGGLSVYAQAGQDHGLGLLWLLVLLAPILFVNQEMVSRLGAVTGAGHARLIFERFGRRWGTFALVDLLALNLLTIVTEFIGVALALGYFGVSRYASVPIAAVALVAITASGSFRRWERAMYTMVAITFVAVPVLVLAGLHASSPAASVSSEHPSGHLLLFMVALVGTTVAPWQLFFHQSNVVDKRITARWLGYERADTLVGTLVFTVGAVAVLGACAAAFSGTALHGGFIDAGATAEGLREGVGPWAGALFAVALLNGSVLGAGAVTLGTSYAIGDVFGVKHSLHRHWRDASVFHGSFLALVAVAAVVVLIPDAPLGIATVGVQALAGILLPSATVFLLLLCNDRAVLGPRTNPRWLNALAATVVAALVALSALLTYTTLFPHAELVVPSAALAVAGVSVLVFMGLGTATQRPRSDLELSSWERSTWTMPPLETLSAPPRSRGRTVGLVVLRCYLIVAVALGIARVVSLMAAG